LTIGAERSYPYVTGLLVGLAAFFLSGCSVLTAQHSEKILDSVFTVSAIALGFWGTAAALFIPMEERSIVKKLKKGNYFRTLVRYIFAAITWQAVVVATTLAGAAFPESIMRWKWVHHIYAASWIASLLVGVLTTIRAYYCLSEVLKAASPDVPESK
jgi:hypothetical protein